ncbi:MAG: TIGR04282 family arsenosugar biosynthesis glycosyltransferase [Terrimicrobiaceae bacterium]
MTTTASLLLKAPRPGTVKTRLARSLGDAQATAIYRHLVEYQLRQIPPSWACSIHFSPADSELEMRSWLDSFAPPQTRFLPQCEGNLGDRLIAASRADLASGPVVLMGGDCPQLHTDVLLDVAARLSAADVIITPAIDGGYVLLALQSDCPALFDQVPWSSEGVLPATLRNASQAGLRVHLTSPCIDIDDVESFLAFSEKNPSFWPDC